MTSCRVRLEAMGFDAEARPTWAEFRVVHAPASATIGRAEVIGALVDAAPSWPLLVQVPHRRYRRGDRLLATALPYRVPIEDAA